jgi:ABC-type polysaccharide/polyol phosphate export permease
MDCFALLSLSCMFSLRCLDQGQRYCYVTLAALHVVYLLIVSETVLGFRFFLSSPPMKVDDLRTILSVAIFPILSLKGVVWVSKNAVRVRYREEEKID